MPSEPAAAWVRLVVELPNPEAIHPELVRDDVGESLAAWGFDGFSIEVVDAVWRPSAERRRALLDQLTRESEELPGGYR